MAQTHYHAVAWLDHREARIFHFNPDDFTREIVRGHDQHLHHKAGEIGSGHAGADPKYFAAVAKALSSAREILVIGPGAAKTEFMTYLAHAEPAIKGRVAAVETFDHPSDNQVLAHARKFFAAADRMRPRVE